MTSHNVLYLFLAYGAFWVVPMVLLVTILVRLSRLGREVEVLRERLGQDGAERAWAQDGDAAQA